MHDTSNGTQYMLTSSHCFWSFGGVGTGVRNGYVQGSNGNVYANSSTTLIGSVTKNSSLTSGRPRPSRADRFSRLAARSGRGSGAC